MYTVKPVATIYNERTNVEDDYWGDVLTVIELNEDMAEESIWGIADFSHLEIFYYFDRVEDRKIQYGARHPRNNENYPKVGIFAQRGKNRPNKIGATIVKLLKVEGEKLYVSGLDAIDGTPVIDMKPVFNEFLPREEVQQPSWSNEIMEDYWKTRN